MWLINLLFSLFKGKTAAPSVAAPAPQEPVSQPEPAEAIPAGPRRTNQAGIDLIKEFEGLELEAYPDPATGGDPITIGYGHTGPEVKLGQTITKEEAEFLLKKDLEKFEKKVSGMVTVQITDNQFAALVSFAYNCGPANLQSSTLLKLVNAGKFDEASLQFERWSKANGKVMPGLVRRRRAERDLFLK